MGREEVRLGEVRSTRGIQQGRRQGTAGFQLVGWVGVGRRLAGVW